MRPFISVASLVLLEIVIQSKGHATKITDKVTSAVVDLAMLVQLLHSKKLFVTCVTRVDCILAMSLHMLFEKGRVFKDLMAEAAL